MLIGFLGGLVHCAACIAVGMRIEAWMRARRGRPVLARFATSFGLGLVVLWCVLLGLALVPGGFNRWTVSLVLISAFVLGGRLVYADARELIAQTRGRIARGLRLGKWWWMVAVLGVLVATQVSMTAMPPGGDAVAIYMVTPKLLAHYGQLVGNPLFPHLSCLGVAGEMHFASCMLLFSQEACGWFSMWVLFAMVLITTELGREAGLSTRGRLLVAMLILGSEGFCNSVAGGKVCLFAAYPAMIALYWCMQTRNRALPACVLGGVLGGAAIYAKLSLAAILPFMLAVLLVWWWWIGRRFTLHNCARCAGCLLLLGGAALLGYAPNFIKNGIMLGHPFAPFWPTDAVLQSASGHRSHFPTSLLMATYPLALTWGAYPLMYGRISAAIIALLPASVLLPRPKHWWRSPLLQLTCVAVMGVVIWMLVRPRVISPRFFMPPLILLTLLPAKAGVALLQATRPWQWPKRVAWIILPVLVLASIASRERIFHAQVYLLTAYNWETRWEGYVRAAEIIAQTGQPGERVLCLTHHTYYLTPEQIHTTPSVKELRALKDEYSPEDRWRYLYEQGIRYVLVGQSLCKVGLTPQEGFSTRHGELSSADLPPDLTLEVLEWVPGQDAALRLREVEHAASPAEE